VKNVNQNIKTNIYFFYVPKNGTLIGLKFGRDRFKFGATKESSAEEGVHPDVGCDACSSKVCGIRWKCAQCDDWDYCENCMKTIVHPIQSHVFIKIDYPGKLVLIEQRT